MPGAFSRLDLRAFDLVISSSHAFSKAVRVPDGVPHLCYCHTPPRYLWDLYAQYSPGWRGVVRAPVAGVLRRRDRVAARAVTRFIANSHTVVARIHRWYGVEAVVHPPRVVGQGAGAAAEPDEHTGGAGTHQVQGGLVGGTSADNDRDLELVDELLEVECFPVDRHMFRRNRGAADHDDVRAGCCDAWSKLSGVLGGDCCCDGYALVA
jgi:hypothetical protein